MKKIIILLFVVLLISCNKTEISNEDYIYILFATPLREHDIWLKAKEGFDDACELNNIKCDWIGPKTIDTQEMSDVIETGILQGVDAIITQGVISPELINKADEEGIKVVLVDSDIINSNRFVYIGKDFHEQAILLLEEIEKTYDSKKKLKIAIQVAEKSFKIAEDQINEVKEVFSSHAGGFEIISISESKSDQIHAKKEWEKVISENPDINVVLNFGAEGAKACSEVVKEKDIRNQMLIYGVDDMESTLELIRNGDIDGTVVTSFYDYGYSGVNMLVEYIQSGKEPVQKEQSPKLIIVNKGNVDNYEK